MSGARVSVGSSKLGRELRVLAGGKPLRAWLREASEPVAVAILAETRGDPYWSKAVRDLANTLHTQGWTVCCVDLVCESERQDQLVVFDVPLLAERLSDTVYWSRSFRGSRPVAIVASGNAAAAGMWLAAESDVVSALISMSGRPHLAEPRLGSVTCPTLLLVSQHDERLLHVNRMATRRLGLTSRLESVPEPPQAPQLAQAFVEASMRWLPNAMPSALENTVPRARLDWRQTLLSSRLLKSLGGAFLTILSGHWHRW